MNTPRLRSSFPQTPATSRHFPGTPKTDPNASVSSTTKTRSPLPTVPSSPGGGASSTTSTPRIPVHLIDAPSQRLYTVALWGLLFVWRLYDWGTLVQEETTSVSLFVKWSCIDIVYMFGVPLLRIPWLEWSDTTSVVLCLLHGALNGMLMFRIPIPIAAWLAVLIKPFWDREMSISEGHVSPASILHNSSLIMGRQIINILPEGSVTMNPDHLPFCLDSSHPSVQIPIVFNQTRPKHVELQRIDFETNQNETIVLSAKELRKYRKTEDEDVLIVDYVVRKPGLYKLYKVVDQTKLEVQRRMSDILVVACPQARVKSTESDKCHGDLSNLTMEIKGTPPLRIVYSRTVNSDSSVHDFPNIQPDAFDSPLLGSNRPQTLTVAQIGDVSWARTHTINVPLNESMQPSGRWLYSIDSIYDALGNVANFSTGGDDGEHFYPKGSHLEQPFTVHDRPMIRLTGCDSRNPLTVAKGKSKGLPAEYKSPGKMPDDTSHTLTWKFSPLDTLTKSGDHGSDVVFQEFNARNAHHAPDIREPGLYTLVGVKSKYCDGEIKEPASCLLLNPPEPHLTITSENISDKCAGNSIGLQVDLDLIGTPPFVVRYDVISRNGVSAREAKIPGLRYQLELKPREAGHFKYHFKSIDDSVYKGHSLAGESLILEQDVKPQAAANLRRPSSTIDACIEEPIEMNVDLYGEQPFTLEYELVHGGKRTKTTIKDINSDLYTIKTAPLTEGGEYSLAITGLKDKTGCKIFIENNVVEFTVRRQRPKASFGHIEGKRKTVQVEGRHIDLPLRLTGRAPWYIKYRNLNDTSERVSETTLRATNSVLKVREGGIYELLEVSDEQCPGTVDSTASEFEVDWLPRPRIKLAPTAVLIPDGNKFIKREVCEGDVDVVEVNLIGTAPYSVKYRIHHKPESGSGPSIDKEFEAALGSATISMDTSKSGIYEYKFTELSDALYDHDAKKFTPLILEQKVNKKPSAQFAEPGKSYNYCKGQLDGNERIPIKLEGVPPFSLEVDIKHQSSSRPDTVKIANIETNNYDFRIPIKILSLGNHQVSVRKVRDSHGCQQKTEYGAPTVQVKVWDPPTIYPLEQRTDYCVGDRIGYTLAGTAPFEIYYTFEGVGRKAKSASTTFKRIAEKPGNFTITSLKDSSSSCPASTSISKIIHPMPAVKISKGRQVEVDIHEGGEAEILFEFWGTPPFEFTYTRSTNVKRGQKAKVLETRHEVSEGSTMVVKSSLEGTYEVVAIKDKFCSFSTQRSEMESKQKLIQF